MSAPVPIHNTTNLRLEVDMVVPAAGLPNLVRDPNGALGTWELPLLNGADPTSQDTLTSDGTKFVYKNNNTTDATGIIMELVPVPSLAWVRMKWTQLAVTAGHAMRVSYNFYDAAGNYLSGPNYTAPVNVAGSDWYVPIVQAPAGAASMQTFLLLYKGTSQTVDLGASVTFNQLMITYSMTQADVAGAFAFVTPGAWQNILAPTHEIAIDRSELDLGTLTATIVGAALDPATSSALALGTRIRCQADVGGGVFESLFEGWISDADVDYTRDDDTGLTLTKITLEAVDAVNALASAQSKWSYGAVAAIAYLIEALPATVPNVPWNVNGNRSHLQLSQRGGSLAIQDDATALDQVQLIRDSVSGYAWVSRWGVVTAYDKASMPAAVQTTFTDSASGKSSNLNAGFEGYSAVKAGWSTKEIINQVNVNFLRQASGETTEVPYGPYSDGLSVRKYGPREVTVNMVAATEDPTAIQAFANAILAANATAVRKPTSLRMPVLTARAMKHATQLDLYDLVGVQFTSILNGNYRITSIKHAIDADGWTVDYGFAVNGAVASPAGSAGGGAADASTDGTWIFPLLTNGWQAYDAAGSGYMSTRYMRRGGIVYVQIMAKLGTLLSSPFTLPPGYRPGETIITSGVSANVVHRIDIRPDGQITSTGQTGNSYFAVNACFPAEQ